MKPVLKTGLGLHRFQVNRFKPNRFHANRSLNRFETGLETDFDENTKVNFFTK